MPTTSSIAEQQQNSTITPHFLTDQTLSSQEVERICKAFIRLITAEEKDSHGTHDENTNISTETQPGTNRHLDYPATY